MPKISVIVPIYNVEKYLPRCIDSILSQTFTDFELILVDDGSPDNCGEICDEYASRDSRIRVIHKENGGVSSARNAGLKDSVGKWISFVDSDDWLHPQYLELLILLAEKNHAVAAAVDSVKTDTEIIPEPVNFEEILPKIVPCNQSLSGWSNRFYVWGKLFDKSILNGHLFDETISYGEDAIFILQVLGSTGGAIAIADAKLYYYYRRSDSLTSGDRSSKRAALCKAYLNCASEQEDEGVKKQFIISALKRALSTRYTSRIEKAEPGFIRECNGIIASALQEMRGIHNVSRKEILKYQVLYHFPFIYRLWRIRNDHTMLKWEQSVRNNT